MFGPGGGAMSMYRSRFNVVHCRDCSQVNPTPACVQLRWRRPQALVARRTGTVGGNAPASCPCIISWTEVYTYATGLGDFVAQTYIEEEAKQLLKLVRHRITGKRITNPGFDAGYWEAGTNMNNYNGYLAVQADDASRFPGMEIPPALIGNWHFLRRLEEDAMLYMDEFRAVNGLDIDWNDWQTKLVTCIWLARPLILQKAGGQIAGMFAPQAIGMTILCIACMFGPQGALLTFLRLLLNGVGVAVQAYGILSSGVSFVSAVYGARKPKDLEDAAGYFADFLAGLLTVGLLAAFGKALEKGQGAWKESKAKAQLEATAEAEAVAKREGGGRVTKGGGTPVEAGTVSAKILKAVSDGTTGLQYWHLEKIRAWAVRKGALVVLRKPNPAGLRHHFQELIQAKSTDIKWTTAKSGPREGLVVVPKIENAGGATKLMAEIRELQAKGYKFISPEGGFRKLGELVRPGDLVVKDGCVICSDVDKMGIYSRNGNGQWAAHPAWDANNDSLVNSRALNREWYGSGGINLDQHGGQNHWLVRKLEADEGKVNWVQGRRPQEGEKYTVAEPNGDVSVLGLGQLKQLFTQYGIPWPY